MKRLILLFCVFFLLSNHSLSKTDNNSPDTLNNATEISYHSIQFYLINGISSSYKYNLNKNNSLRINIDFSATLFGEEDKYKNRYKEFQQNNITQNESVVSRETQYLNSSVQYLYNVHKIKNIRFYIGAGPLFEYIRYYSKTELIEYENNLPSNKRSSGWIDIEYGVGVIGVAGLECKINDMICIFGEFLPNYVYGWHDNSNDDTSYYTEHIGNYWRFSIKKLMLGISVNF